MKNQIFIRVKKDNDFINKDITNLNYKERMEWYNSLSKGQITKLLEQLGDFGD